MYKIPYFRYFILSKMIVYLQYKFRKMNKQKANEVLQQLGGNRFIVMTGAKNFVYSEAENFLSFKIGGGAKAGINFVKITLNSLDLYRVEFSKLRACNLKVVAEFDGVYCDTLQEIFTQTTGFRTRLS